MTFFTTCSIIASRSRSLDTSGECWVEMTTLRTATGLPSSYWTVTCDFESGRRKSNMPSLRTWVRCFTRWCASEIGSGISSGVSSQAKPNMSPWSPAPWSSSLARSTPIAMSGD